MTWFAVIGLALVAYLALSLFACLVTGPLLERVSRHYAEVHGKPW